jgi:hypothetical protein
MKAMEWTNIDRKDWPAGEWDSEPDLVQWPDEKTGLPCLAKRHPRGGHWCGYVGVSEGHKAFEKEYGDVEVDVHGGLTFSSFCDGEPGKGICHLPEPGEPDRVWWLGFDCHHYNDYSPRDKMFERDRPEPLWMVDVEASYRTLQYVKNQCAALAEQLRQLGDS